MPATLGSRHRATAPHRRALALLTAAMVMLAVLPVLTSAPPAQAVTVSITNRTQFRDTAGNVIHAHGGGIIKVAQYYYWFGESRNADFTFRAVTAYRSTDLKNWEFRNNVLSPASAAELRVSNIERPKVIYNRTTGQFVMWMHKENGRDYGEARAAVATSSTIDGNYTYRGSFRPFNQHMSRDITAFVDDDGTGYMISAARENYDLHVYRLTADYTNVAALVRAWPGDHREAPALFKRNGVYFMLTSGATSWVPNQQKYATARSITGPWSAWQNVGDSTTFGTQTTFVLPIQGSQTTSYLYLGDRWGPGFGTTYANSQYTWLPLNFPSDTTMTMSWHPQITVDTATGVVSGVNGGGASGPYVQLVSRHSGRCADVVDGSLADTAEVAQWGCWNGPNQQWEVRDAGGGFVRLVARHSGLCLDVANASAAEGAPAIQYTCGAGTNQQWQFVDAGGGYSRIVARHSGKCLDVSNASQQDNARLVQYTCTGAANQQWQRRQV
ncbi:MAG TPA: RICIN domain-containing protein [Micromonosporaceae bacterium]|nr:RICIN domain-containing protein [Micromonosporaceae bacterium]